MAAVAQLLTVTTRIVTARSPSSGTTAPVPELAVYNQYHVSGTTRKGSALGMQSALTSTTIHGVKGNERGPERNITIHRDLMVAFEYPITR